MDRVRRPTFIEEKNQRRCGYRNVAGIDEAGRGPLAGPVVAAAVILPPDFEADWKHLVNDSKQLTASVRETLFDCISDMALSIGVGLADVGVIDSRGIVKATRLAMKRAVEQLEPPPDYLLIDYMVLPEVRLPQKGITHGDCLCFSIACASIIAKVTRDRLMIELSQTYPEYKFDEHKGYGTRGHLECLRRLGPSPIHRRSFQPVKELCMLL
ncbi:MAG: ribonuclease HII [Dehalococcoidales bacterium]|nr:ribonuclease HII [Dehalococcoidales bacterium]